MMATFVFYLFAVAAVLGAVLCVLQRSAVVSAMWLASTMFSLAGLFVLLHAELLGILQILVYVGAVLVLFLFVVMLLNLDRDTGDLRGPAGIASAVTIGGLLLVELISLWRYTPGRLAGEVAQAPGAMAAAFPAGAAAREAVAHQGVVGAIAQPMFQAYLVPFEITSILLLTALVGAVVLAKRRI
ncbi:MAG TPA: NADH-quinone oxidoreductase subunit J [Gemmatimonadales bacterium]|jgi:NADH-quinone oxidoreductase subunit J|nr:NADH-quinone oxidoreductase subunit J [Gemmatimonadales bacterium]